MAITSLFGPTPQQVLMARQKEAQEQTMLRNQQIAQQGGQFGAFAPLYQAGLRFGDVATQAAMQGLFPQQADPALQQASAVQSVLSKYSDQDQSSPEVLTKIGRELMSVAPDAGIKALTLAQQLSKEDKLITAKPGERIFRRGAGGALEMVAEIPDDEDPLKAASRDKFNEIYAKYPDTPEGRARAAVEFRNWDNTFKERVSAASNVAGDLKPQDVAAVRNIAEDIYGKDKSKLTTVGEIKTYISEIRKGNPAAVPQLRRSLVKLVGDNQIGQNEVAQALGSGGFTQDVIEGVNRFLTGLPTNLKADQIEQAVNALEDYYGTRFNRGRESASSLLKDTKIPGTTIDKIVGKPYTSANQKKNAQFQEGKIYRDANGNTARYVNGKFEPVK